MQLNTKCAVLRLRRSIWSNGRLDAGATIIARSEHGAWLKDHQFADAVSDFELISRCFDLSQDSWLIANNATPGDSYPDPLTGRTLRILDDHENLASCRIEETERRAIDADIDYTIAEHEFSVTFGRRTGSAVGSTTEQRLWEALAHDVLDDLGAARLRLCHLEGLPEYQLASELLRPAIDASSRVGPRGQLVQCDADLIGKSIRSFDVAWERGLRRVLRRQNQTNARNAWIKSADDRRVRSKEDVIWADVRARREEGRSERHIPAVVARKHRVTTSYVRQIRSKKEQTKPK